MEAAENRTRGLGSPFLFRAMWLLLAAASALGMIISWRTGHPAEWQPVFMMILAGLGLGAGFVALRQDTLLRVQDRFFALRRHDSMLALIFMAVVALSLVAAVYLTASSQTYLGIAPLILGASLLILVIVGSSNNRRSLLELSAKAIFSLVVMVVIIIMADVAVSSYYRRIDYWTDSGTHQRVPDLGWGLRPNLNMQAGEFTSNSLGHRTPVEPDSIPPDTLVIGVQGDSQLEAFSINQNDTFDQVLQACLSDAGIPATVINLGVGGYDLHQYLTQSSTVVEQYGLDWLIMLFNSRNDYDRAMLKATYGAYRPFWVLEDGQLQQIALEEPFALQIFPVEFQDSFAEYNRYLSYEDTIQFSIDPDHPLASSWLYITTERWLWDVRPRSEPSQAEIDDFEFYISGWWKFEDPIPEPFASYQPTFEAIMSAWAQQANHTQVFILPDRREILWEEETEPLVADAFERMGKAAPNPTVFLDWITQMDMPSYSFYDDMMAVDEPPALFLPGDSHLSPAGYRLIGEAACQQLQFAVD